MQTLKRLLVLGVLVLVGAWFLAVTPVSANAQIRQSTIVQSTQTMFTTGWANVRTGASTSKSVVITYAPNTRVTVYQTVNGQVVWGGIRTWYRISSLSSAPRYIYGGLLSKSNGFTPPTQGKSIVVNLSQQRLYAYVNGKQVYTTLVTTGRPELPTPTGTFRIFVKLHPTTFYSSYPIGSPYYYAPTYINYALEFQYGGYFLHDSWWRNNYGPGTQYPHHDSSGNPSANFGSHGCINMPVSAAAWLYNWAPIGTTVKITY
ncbi:L,D-transpeptidase family protein [Ktedonospora formicarum]|uniref:L,D-TPase catalytic domain-containing protein n=1 Tax=Ktedonospora formicarum TaxID=2778364 RepID=A0A8J3MNI0_9CHLR|nr:L,D-transpeptidase family protein [Ktedonospora formicarum]GHO41935.1 hypothetical protein KSX_00980 [Ktedonospora formicarum]